MKVNVSIGNGVQVGVGGEVNDGNNARNRERIKGVIYVAGPRNVAAQLKPAWRPVRDVRGTYRQYT